MGLEKLRSSRSNYRKKISLSANSMECFKHESKWKPMNCNYRVINIEPSAEPINYQSQLIRMHRLILFATLLVEPTTALTTPSCFNCFRCRQTLFDCFAMTLQSPYCTLILNISDKSQLSWKSIWLHHRPLKYVYQRLVIFFLLIIYVCK